MSKFNEMKILFTEVKCTWVIKRESQGSQIIPLKTGIKFKLLGTEDFQQGDGSNAFSEKCLMCRINWLVGKLDRVRPVQNYSKNIGKR